MHSFCGSARHKMHRRSQQHRSTARITPAFWSNIYFFRKRTHILKFYFFCQSVLTARLWSRCCMLLTLQQKLNEKTQQRRQYLHAIRVEAIATRLEAVAIGVEAIAFTQGKSGKWIRLQPPLRSALKPPCLDFSMNPLPFSPLPFFQ